MLWVRLCLILHVCGVSVLGVHGLLDVVCGEVQHERGCRGEDVSFF